MRQALGAFTIVCLVLFSLMLGAVPAKLVVANPLPSPVEIIEITSPKNDETYYADKILLAINVTTTYSCTLFYSLDGQAMKQIENMTVNSRVDINAGKNPPIYRLVLNASAWVSVPLGAHNITVYQINPNTEQIVGQAEVIFNTDASENNIPEFPSWTILTLVLTFTLFSVVVKRKLPNFRLNIS